MFDCNYYYSLLTLEIIFQHLSDPLFAEFLEAHGQEKILKDIEESDKAEELSTQEKTNEEEPTNKIANANISDFEVCFIH